MRFTINLATRTILDQRRIDRACVTAVVVLAFLLAGLILLFSWNFGEQRRLDAEAGEMKKQLTRPLPKIPENEQEVIMADIAFYNEIIKRKSYGWLGLLEKLEVATPNGISLTLLSPNKEKGSLSIQGWALNFKALEEYLAQLEDSENFSDVLLLSHEKDELWEQAKGVRFTLSCRVREQ